MLSNKEESWIVVHMLVTMKMLVLCRAVVNKKLIIKTKKVKITEFPTITIIYKYVASHLEY